MKFRSPSPVIDAAFLNLIAIVAIISAWEIYESWWFVITAAVTILVANASAFFVLYKKIRPLFAALILLGGYLFIAIIFGVPSVYSNLSDAPFLILKVITAPVTGWKDLLTLDLPLGTFQATLAPTIFIFLSATFAAILIAWSAKKLWFLAAPIMFSLLVYAAAFGSSFTTSITKIIFDEKHLFLGLSVFLVALLWLVWRSAAVRRIALQNAASAVGQSAKSTINISKNVAAAAILIFALGIGIVLGQFFVTGSSRDVLRTNIAPEKIISQKISPLSTYRDFFTDENYQKPILKYEAGEEVKRITLLNLNSFDGAKMGMNLVAGEESSAFLRVPSNLKTQTEPSEVTIELLDYQEVWVPLAGSLSSIEFYGDGKSSLSDGFYYSTKSATGVQLSERGFLPEDRIEMRVQPGALESDRVSSFEPARGGASLDKELIPESLADWVDSLALPRSGSGLLEAVETLRARSVLSHSLNIEDGEQPLWLNDLNGAEFAPSRAGHSTDRLNRTFSELLDRQAAVTNNALPEMLVATAGDAEQLAVASWLLADHFGFEARVGVGFMLSSAEDEVFACTGGVCASKNLTAWLEVQDALTGQWAAIVTTPQHALPISKDLTHRSDPKNASDVTRPKAELVPPLDANPIPAAQKNEEQDLKTNDLGLLFAVLKIASLTLLTTFVLLSPLLLILALKSVRRKTRRSITDPSENVAAAWEEFIDISIDYGAKIPANETRKEIAALYAGDVERATWLADVADHADYSSTGAEPDSVSLYWQAVIDEEKSLREATIIRKRIRAKFSLRSIRYWFKKVSRTVLD